MPDRESWDGTARGAYEIGRLEGAQAERAKLDCNSPNWKDGWQTRDAEDGFIRQEAAQAERERILAVIAPRLERARDMGTGDLFVDLLLSALGVHPEASDG